MTSSTRIPHIYRVPLLLSITLAIIVVALRVEKEVFNIILIILGSLLGTFVLDLDYAIHAFFIDPDAPFSKSISDYIKHKDFRGFLRFIAVHKDDITDKTLNSGLFQVVLGAAMLFVVASDASIFVKALILSSFLNSIYRFAEHYVNGTSEVWFWSLKISQDKKTLMGYGAVLVVALIYCLTLL